ncbi:MAG TPA: hypothetical protein DC053_01010 [Lachnoclostridium sp.]|nr:hypothetical protein [Lachnoclostridium sp.]
MSSTNKTSLGLNMWEASDKPVRQDFVNDNVIIDEKITKLNSDLQNQIVITNSNLEQRYALVGGNDIPANTDLNNLMTIGNYRCSSNSAVPTLKNCPTAGAFTLKVVGGTGWDSYQQQFLCAYDGATYFRWYNTFGSPPAWSAWKKLY